MTFLEYQSKENCAIIARKYILARKSGQGGKDMYESLTEYIDRVEKRKKQDWNLTIIKCFTKDVNAFVKKKEKLGLINYWDVIQKHGIDFRIESLMKLDVSEMDAKPVLALIVAAVREERTCDGAYLGYFEKGLVMKWLERLRQIDNSRGMSPEVRKALFAAVAEFAVDMEELPKTLKEIQESPETQERILAGVTRRLCEHGLII